MLIKETSASSAEIPCTSKIRLIEVTHEQLVVVGRMKKQELDFSPLERT